MLSASCKYWDMSIRIVACLDVLHIVRDRQAIRRVQGQRRIAGIIQKDAGSPGSWRSDSWRQLVIRFDELRLPGGAGRLAVGGAG